MSDIAEALLKRAREIDSLLSSIAEHHPYWPAAHYLTQALQALFEKWNTDFSDEELDELMWYIDKAKDSLQKLRRT